MLEVVNQDGLVCQKRDEPHDFTDSHLEVLGLNQLVTKVFQTAVASCDLLGSLGGQKQGVFLITDGDVCRAFHIHESVLLD